MFGRSNLFDDIKDFLMETAVKGIDTYRGSRYDGFKIGVAAVLGVAVGVGVGLLLAPKAGEELRADIKEKASQLRSRASEMGDRVGQMAERATSNGTRAPQT